MNNDNESVLDVVVRWAEATLENAIEGYSVKQIDIIKASVVVSLSDNLAESETEVAKLKAENDFLKRQNASKQDILRTLVDENTGGLTLAELPNSWCKAHILAYPAGGYGEAVWHKMSTAPKDGTLILLWDGKERNIASFRASSILSTDEPDWIIFNSGNICDYCQDETISVVENPLAWTELPNPPKTIEEQWHNE